MTEDFPGDYYPFGEDVVVLIEWFGVVQFLGRSRITNSHACYASLTSRTRFFGTAIAAFVWSIPNLVMATRIRRIIILILSDAFRGLTRKL